MRPESYRVSNAAVGRTLAVFLPAYKEEANLPGMIHDLVDYLRSLGLLEFRVFIINDGSPDATGAVADGLAHDYPEVAVIHHPENRGYGGALITGFNAVVGTGFDWWAFMDSDRQFAPESLGTLFLGYVNSDADMVVGRRLGRRNADSPFRFYLGRAWHFFGRIVVGRAADGRYLLDVDDVDCGIKMGSIKSLNTIVTRLRGQAAAISPELIARTILAGQRIAECGVTHLARQAGTSTGDKPKVMIRSAWNILLLGAHFRWAYYFDWAKNAAEDAQHNLATEGW